MRVCLDNTLPNRLAANIEVVEDLLGFEAGQRVSRTSGIGYGWSWMGSAAEMVWQGKVLKNSRR